MTDPDGMTLWRERYATAVAAEDSLDFDEFTYADAWALGRAMVERAMRQHLPVAIAIVFGTQHVFHAALAGSAATNDDWLARKIRTVAQHNRSSWAVACMAKATGSDYFIDGGYDRSRLALAGGAVPLRVRGSLIGAVGVSGLEEYEDHAFVISAMRAMI